MPSPRLVMTAVAVALAACGTSGAFAQGASGVPRGAAPAPASAPVPAPNPPAVPAAPAAPSAPAAPLPADLDARLADAHRRLEAAAREVAELSMRGGARGDRLIVAGEPPRRAILGVQVDPASGRDGARIAQVSPGGPADAAGLRPGDVIQALGGTDLRGRDDAARALVERMADAQPDETLRARVLRDGRVREVEVTARRSPALFAARVAPFDLPPLPPDGAPRIEWLGEGPAVSGMELATLTPALGRYFGTDKGVLVVRAPRQAEWKLEDGDVLLAIDGREPTSGAHATRILRSYQRGESLRLRVMRQRKPLEFVVAVPEPQRSAGRRARVLRLEEPVPGAEALPDPARGEPPLSRPLPQ